MIDKALELAKERAVLYLSYLQNELHHAMEGHILDSYTLKAVYKKM